ncbi:MAG: RNA polymerase sigma factor [Gemmatimonadota bacterium]
MVLARERESPIRLAPLSSDTGRQREERRLLSAVKAGDAAALEAVYRARSQDVYRLALRLTESPADAKDVMQEVFLGLPEALRTYDGSKSFHRWLMRVTTRTALMKMRARRRRREVSLRTLGAFRGSHGEPPVLDRLDVERALERLPEALRSVFVLREIEGFSHEEIAELLGIRRGTSEVRLFRARHLLRNWLRET